MSLLQNSKWIEAAYENFRTSLEEGNISLCKAVIADMKENQYHAEAYICERELGL